MKRLALLPLLLLACCGDPADDLDQRVKDIEEERTYQTEMRERDRKAAWDRVLRLADEAKQLHADKEQDWEARRDDLPFYWNRLEQRSEPGPEYDKWEAEWDKRIEDAEGRFEIALENYKATYPGPLPGRDDSDSDP